MSTNQVPGFPVTQIMTHREPHPDEIWAIYLAQHHGEERYPGISQAQVHFSAVGNQTPDGRPVEDWEQEGWLFIGTGGGRFDEHPTMTGRPGKKNACALTLMAKDLGLCNEPMLRKILPCVLQEDLEGSSGDMFTLARSLKTLYRVKPQEEVLALALQIVDAHYQDQLAFVAAERIVASGQWLTVNTGRQVLKIVAVESDNCHVNQAARRHGAGLIIQKQPGGNVQIYSDKQVRLDLRDLVRLLRLEENRLRQRPGTADWQLLEAEGKQHGQEEWYFHPQGGWIFNGSLSAPDVSPTVIPLGLIVELAELALSPDFHRDFYQDCRAGRCAGQNCSWYSAGLIRCRDVRFVQLRHERGG